MTTTPDHDHFDAALDALVRGDGPAVPPDNPEEGADLALAGALLASLAPLQRARPGYQERLAARLAASATRPPETWWRRLADHQAPGIPRWQRAGLGAALILATLLAAVFAYPRAQPVGAAAVLQRAGETAGDGRAFGLASYHGVITWRTRAVPDGPLGPEERQEVWFGGPGRLRVAFARGFVVRDGAVVWYYQPASKTAARLDPATTFGGDGGGAFTPAGTAAMLGRATDTFDATLAGEEVVAGRVARIVELRRRAPLIAPRSTEERTVVRRLWIDRDTYQLLGGEDRDGAGDTITTWRYASLEVNPDLDAALFAFTPPADAHVVDARATPSPTR